MSTTRLLDHFSALDAPRQSLKVTYPLPEVLLIVLCATMAGAEDFVQIELWANRKLDFLRRFLPFEKKSNEITAIPTLLERLELSGALVTTDAMGCQTKIAGAIRDKGADYLPALKDNWPALRTEVERFFADPEVDSCKSDHGRIETRRHAVCHQIDWLKSDRRYFLSSAKLSARRFATAVRAHWHVENRLH